MIAELLDNRYKILETLGNGGFGETYLATDIRMPSGRKCVIKLLKPVAETPQQQQWIEERFEREAVILEQLGEKNQQIPKLYGYFGEAGKYYLVQEWIEGLTLSQTLKQQGKLSEAKVKEILQGILPILSYVHSRKIVHRDIKPDNIILRSRDGKPVLIDFGAVKEAMTTEADGSRSVALSMAIGTPGYMPSEQAAGRPLYSSDLYSLGLTAIYLLTGKLPQDLETNPNNGEIIWQKHRRMFDRNLARVIDRAIRFHPRDRFSSAKEMLEAIADSSNNTNVTTATVAVAPQVAPLPQKSSPETPTLATNAAAAALETPEESDRVKFALPLLLLSTIGTGGFILASSLLNSPEQKIGQIEEPPPPKQEEVASVETLPPPIKEPEISQPEETPLPEEEHKDLSGIIDPQIKPDERLPIEREERKESFYERGEEYRRPPVTTRNLERVPIFRTGVDKNRIIAALGQPTRNQKGYFGNTQALAYIDFVPDRVSLGYIYDRNTERLVQTEVSFDRKSVDLQIMEETLNSLLRGRLSEPVSEALKEVYYGQTDLRSFQAGRYKGTIKREARRDTIYIGVWDASFRK